MRRRGSAAEAAPVAEPTVASTLDPTDQAIVDRVRQYTMTSAERIVATIDAVTYLQRRAIPGAFVECGVWRGGMVLTMLLTLQRLGADDRDVYLFDTFEGMTEPTEHDRSAHYGGDATEEWKAAQATGARAWPEQFGAEVFDLDGVKRLLRASGYPDERLHFVQGPVEETIPDAAPKGIALLRLDTDWYQSTKHELDHLYPRLADGGVLLIDDYGHWEGCRRAVDEYFEASGRPELLFRTDYTGRATIKRAGGA